MKTTGNDQLPTFAEAVRTWRAATEAAGCPDRLASEVVPLMEAAGRVPARIIRTQHPCPTYRAAAMDGFAIRSEQVAAASKDDPVRLRLGGDAQAIDTGEAVPEEFDAVVTIESVRIAGRSIFVSSPCAPGKNVRLPGEDVPPGVAIGWPGFRLRPLDCASLVASGCTSAEVVRRPRVAIVPTGDEVVPPGSPSKPGTVIESNSMMIAAEARLLGAEVEILSIVRDDEAAIETALRDAIGRADLVALIAGSSRGRRDRGATAIAAIGVVDVHVVATRPGRPVVLGHAGSVPIINLPGYPVSCHFAFDAYVAPLLRRMGGAADPAPRRARLAEAIDTDGVADEWQPASLLTSAGSPRAIVVPFAEIGGSLYRLAQADARFHLRRGVGRFPRHAAVPWTPLREVDDVARPLFVGPYDPLMEELAALGGFRCRWTDDESGAALEEGLADAVGLIIRDGGLADLRKRAGLGRKVLPVGSRREGIARRSGGSGALISRAEARPLQARPLQARPLQARPLQARPLQARPLQESDPWVGVAEVAADIRTEVHTSRYVAERFGLAFEESDPALYAIVWEERPGHRFPWGIVLAAGISALEGAAVTLGWRSIGIPTEVVPS